MSHQFSVYLTKNDVASLYKEVFAATNSMITPIFPKTEGEKYGNPEAFWESHDDLGFYVFREADHMSIRTRRIPARFGLSVDGMASPIIECGASGTYGNALHPTRLYYRNKGYTRESGEFAYTDEFCTWAANIFRGAKKYLTRNKLGPQNQYLFYFGREAEEYYRSGKSTSIH